MRSEQELKEVYINSHHKALEKFFDDLLTLKNDETNAEDMFTKIKKEVDKQELTDEEKEYIKDHVKQWACDNDLLHDLQRHIFKKLIDNKEKLLKDLDKKKF